MDWSGIKNRWQAAFGQKKPAETGMPAERRQELESTISLLTKMNRLDQLLEIIREHREIYSEPWLLQAELSIVRQLNAQDSLETAEPEDLEHRVNDDYQPLSESSGEEWPDQPASAAQSKPSLDCDDDNKRDEDGAEGNEPAALTEFMTQDESSQITAGAEARDIWTVPVFLSTEEEPEQLPEADAITIEFDPDDVIELIEQIDEEDDPDVWREELDPFMWDTVVDEVKEVNAPSTRIGREARARQVAAELIAKHDWPHQALPVLTEIFNRKAYGPAKVALDTLMTRGLTLPILILAVHVRAIWHNSPAYWVCFNKTGDVADDSQYLLSWPAAINVLNAFSELPSVEELEWFLEEQLEYWRNHRDLRRCFRSFRLYLWYRTADLKGTLPPDEWRNFDRLSNDSWS